jgi:hypothetical protein
VHRWFGELGKRPFSIAYLSVLLVDYWIVAGLMARPQAVRILYSLSTNISNLLRRPAYVLIGSALVPAPPLLSLTGLLTVGVGLGVCLGLIERRFGSRTAVGVFAAGHIGATLLTVPVIVLAVALHRYPHEVFRSFDFGVSYGSVASIAAVVAWLPRWLCGLCIVFGVAYLIYLATWYGVVPDFTTVGHLWAVAIGLSAGGHLKARQVRAAPAGWCVQVPDAVDRRGDRVAGR